MSQPTTAGESLPPMADYQGAMDQLAEREHPRSYRERPWEPQLGEGETPTVATAVYQALGAASMAWNPPPSGVFVSEHARWVGEGLLAWLQEHGVDA